MEDNEKFILHISHTSIYHDCSQETMRMSATIILNTTVRHELPLSSVIWLDLTVKA